MQVQSRRGLGIFVTSPCKVPIPKDKDDGSKRKDAGDGSSRSSREKEKKKQAYGVAKNQNRPIQQGSTVGNVLRWRKVKEDSIGNKRKRPTHLKVPDLQQQKKGGEDGRAQPQASGEEEAQAQLQGHEGKENSKEGLTSSHGGRARGHQWQC